MMPDLSQEPPASFKSLNEDLKGMDVLSTSKIKIQNLTQEPPAFSKAPNQDLKDMDVLCTFKIKIESKNLEHRCTGDT